MIKWDPPGPQNTSVITTTILAAASAVVTTGSKVDAINAVDAIPTAAGKAHTILDGALPPIDQLGMHTKADRPCYYSAKHKRHGLNVQLLSTNGRPRPAPPP